MSLREEPALLRDAHWQATGRWVIIRRGKEIPADLVPPCQSAPCKCRLCSSLSWRRPPGCSPRPAGRCERVQSGGGRRVALWLRPPGGTAVSPLGGAVAPPLEDSAVPGLGAAGWIAALRGVGPSAPRSAAELFWKSSSQAGKRWQTASCSAGEEGGRVGPGTSSYPVLVWVQSTPLWLPGSAGLAADPLLGVLGGALGPELNPSRVCSVTAGTQTGCVRPICSLYPGLWDSQQVLISQGMMAVQDWAGERADLWACKYDPYGSGFSQNQLTRTA